MDCPTPWVLYWPRVDPRGPQGLYLPIRLLLEDDLAKISCKQGRTLAQPPVDHRRGWRFWWRNPASKEETALPNQKSCVFVIIFCFIQCDQIDYSEMHAHCKRNVNLPVGQIYESSGKHQSFPAHNLRLPSDLFTGEQVLNHGHGLFLSLLGFAQGRLVLIKKCTT